MRNPDQTIRYVYLIDTYLKSTKSRYGTGCIVSPCPIPLVEGQKLTVRLKGADHLHRTQLVQVDSIEYDFCEVMMAQNEDGTHRNYPTVAVDVTVRTTLISE